VKRILLLILIAAVMASGVLAGCNGGADTTPTTPASTTPAPTTPAGEVSPEVGKYAPDFTLTTVDGKTVTLSSLRGKPVLINFWFTACAPCAKEMPYFQELSKTWPAKGLEFLSIDIGDKASKVSEYMEYYAYTFPVLLDSKSNVALKYGIMYAPTTIIIDKDGVIKLFKVGEFVDLKELEGEIQLNLPDLP
jgi:peroxiredoxin